jgi:NDP-sugar pyrophosphorylase family protein
MKAMILAAGFGTRLWPLTIGRTKPAMPFLNRPLIAFTLDYLKRYGFDEVIINLHHEPDSVRAQLGDGAQYGLRIHYSVEEPEILGTAGALDRVRERLERETFVVVNGKIITDIDLQAALQTHRARQALATLVLRPNTKRERFSEIILAADGRIEKFAGFPPPDNPQSATRNPQSPLMFTGIHILEPAIFDYIPRGVPSDSVRDVYPQAMAAGKALAAHVAENCSWHELSTLERYLSISREFLGRSGQNVVLDEGCVIDSSAEVKDSILWKRVRVEGGAKLSECIVGDDVVIPAQAEFQRVAIVRAELAANHPPPAVGRQSCRAFLRACLS